MAADPQHAQRILIVRLSALGDVVHVLPLLDALRRARPEAHIGWLVEERAASLLEGHPQLDRVWVHPRRQISSLLSRGRAWAALQTFRRFLAPLRAAGYELAIDVQSNLRSSALALASGASQRIGFDAPFAKEGSRWLHTRSVRPAGEPQLKVLRNLRLLEPLGIDTAGVRARLAVPERTQVWTEGGGPDARGPRVALHPGVSDFGAIKRWAPERYGALAQRLHQGCGADVLVTWGPGDRPLAEAVAAASDGAARVAPETRSILELAALLAAGDLVVGSDTGPVHLAAALGVPVVGLYGPKDPAVYAPWDARTGGAAATVWKNVHCSPCTLRRCNNVICMPAIQVEDVEAAARRILAEAAAQTPASGLGGGAS